MPLAWIDAVRWREMRDGEDPCSVRRVAHCLCRAADNSEERAPNQRRRDRNFPRIFDRLPDWNGQPLGQGARDLEILRSSA